MKTVQNFSKIINFFINLSLLQKWFDFSYKKVIFVLVFLFCSGILMAVVGILHLSNSLIETQALQNAQLSTESLNKSWTHYSENVVQRVKNIPDFQVRSQYKKTQHAIPNPSTFVIELGELLSQEDQGMSIRLYSKFPFPYRQKTGEGIRNEFEQDAIDFLEKNPTQQFYRQEMVGNNMVFRYAEAVVMKPSCVECHNTLLNSPKKDWQVGDVRGIVSISQPLDQIMLIAKDGVKKIIFSLSSIIGLAFLGILFILGRLRSFNQELTQKVREQTAELEQLAIIDFLTQLYNRRHFDSVLEQEWRRSQRQQKPLSLILGDIDYFKKYNDTYGHQAGDQCLVKVAAIMKDVTKRAGDLVARYGGEEFVILLPDTNAQGATAFVQLLQNKIREANLIHETSLVAKQVTMSIGIATLVPQKNLQPKDLIELADRALYEVKENGRNSYRIKSCSIKE